ncbi:ZN282 protein, partial [Rhinopomastus cyanomelas]|nr:ZN282 protein [Rhinopomastus cyanomelas]
PVAEAAFYEPEASSQHKQIKEAFPEELQSEDLQRDPDTGFQTYATNVLSWIKQEEEPRCTQAAHLAREGISPDPRTAHGEDTKRDPPADSCESSACDADVPGRPKEKCSKAPSPVVPWDSQWNSEIIETNSTGNSLGGDAQYDRGLGEHLDFFSPQEDCVGKRPCASNKCESSCSLQEQLQALQGAREGETFPVPVCDKTLSRKVSPLLRCSADSNAAPGSAPVSGQLTHAENGPNLAGGTRLPDHDGIGAEESEENFPAENPFTTPCCWDHPPDKPEGCSRCRRGSPGSQQQSQGRGKSYICSACGKSFVCHSWLVRHQMTHTGERPYKCSECDKSYRRKDYLLNHQRRHSGEGLFQCPLCRKRFVLRRSLVKHQESHVQETHLAMAGWPCTEIRGAVMHTI